MKNTKFSILLVMLFCALLAKSQEAKAQDAVPKDSTWEADPLDVIEPQKAAPEPVVPEFKEVPPPEVAAPAPAPAEKTVHEAPAPDTSSSQASSGGGGTDEPNLKKEKRFHTIYKKYNEQPTSVEAWEKALSSRKAEIYSVEKGNTLWDLSNTFFGDSQFWPKIWALNSGSISNPHEINPAMRIKFFPGDINEAPTVELANGETTTKDTVVDTEAVEGTATVARDGTALPPAKTHIPVLKNLPGSLPKGPVTLSLGSKIPVEIQMGKRNYGPGLEYMGYYVADVPVKGVGKITATEMDGQTAGDFQYVYVHLNAEGEKNYVVQENLSEINDTVQKGRKAQMIEVQGEIQILDKVNASKNIYRALVTKAIQPLEVGAVLTPGKLPMFDPAASPVGGGGGVKIIGGQFGKSRTLFGANSLIFMNGGSNKGLQVGQSFNIYADEALRNRETDSLQNDRPIGTAKVINATANFATAYITTSNDDILAGDYVGAKSVASNSESAVESHPEESKDLDQEFESAPEEAPTAPGSDDGDLVL